MNWNFKVLVSDICKTLNVPKGENLESPGEITRIFNAAIEKIQVDTSENLSLTRRALTVLAAHESEMIWLTPQDPLFGLLTAIGKKVLPYDMEHILDELEKNPKLFETKVPTHTKFGIHLENGSASEHQKMEFLRMCLATWGNTEDEALQRKLKNLMNVMKESLLSLPYLQGNLSALLLNTLASSVMNKAVPLELIAYDAEGTPHRIRLKEKHVFLSPFLEPCLPLETEGAEVEEVPVPYSFEKVDSYLRAVEGELNAGLDNLLGMREISRFLQDDVHTKLFMQRYQSVSSFLTPEERIDQIAKAVSTSNNDLEPFLMRSLGGPLWPQKTTELLEFFKNLHERLKEDSVSITTMHLDGCKVDTESLGEIAKLFPNIEKLSLRHVETLERFPEVTWDKLKEIDASKSSLSDVSALLTIPNLEVADFSGSPGLDNVDSLKGKKMKSLDIRGTPVGDSIENRYPGRGSWKEEFPLLEELLYTDFPRLDEID